ncbi:MAG: hypothetical protein WBH71_04195 [Bacteroidales bacterium]|jgi:MFS family permease|nr:hypothetical protein [Bacteroidales bacterium]MDI9593104.1 hypothetical protein [Bacteroidota bacterium]NLH34040.1 hypothetical protein [Lentimicrobium sp.]MBP7873693.1 hypothetical protein [Bacteroidales bacterium]MCO6467641.1 hypothetical protein [Bacteroidales bacterium]
MNTRNLLPHSWRKVGWILSIIGIVLGLLYLFDSSILSAINVHCKMPAIVVNDVFTDIEFFTLSRKDSILDEIIVVLLTVGLVLVGFTRERHEDEYIAQLRLESLVWATYVNLALIVCSTLLVYGAIYLTVMVVLLYFTQMSLFIIKFRVAMYRLNRSRNEE